MGIKPAKFKYKDESITSKECVGVIAEDFYEVFPEFTENNEDGILSYVQYENLIIPSISELQRLNKIIDVQNSEISNLKSELSSVKSTLNCILETINTNK